MQIYRVSGHFHAWRHDKQYYQRDISGTFATGPDVDMVQVDQLFVVHLLAYLVILEDNGIPTDLNHLNSIWNSKIIHYEYCYLLVDFHHFTIDLLFP